MPCFNILIVNLCNRRKLTFPYKIKQKSMMRKTKKEMQEKERQEKKYVHLFSMRITVRPLLSCHLLTGHPPLSGHFRKSRFICHQTAVFDTVTSIQRPPLLSGRGYLFVVARTLVIWFFTSIKRSEGNLSEHWRIILYTSSVNYLKLNFFTY